MGKTGRKSKSYSAEFKISVIMDMQEHRLGYNETIRKYQLSGVQTVGAKNMLRRCERIFLEEGAEGLMKERRGRACAASGAKKGRPPKLDSKVEEDLIAENQRLIQKQPSRILHRNDCFYTARAYFLGPI